MFLSVCQPKAGNEVLVSGAAGATGSIVRLRLFYHLQCLRATERTNINQQSNQL
jgi:hypothetical protein